MDVTPFLEVSLKTDEGEDGGEPRSFAPGLCEVQIKEEPEEPAPEFCQVLIKEEPVDENGEEYMEEEEEVAESEEDGNTHEESEHVLQMLPPPVEEEQGNKASRRKRVKGSWRSNEKSETAAASDVVPIDLSKKEVTVTGKRKGENSTVERIMVTQTPEETPRKKISQCWEERSPSQQGNKIKQKNNEGREYISESKKKVCSQILGSPCSCKNNCRERLLNKKEFIFKNFWDLGSYDLQNSYLFGCIKTYPKKRCYPKKTKSNVSGRSFTAEYSVKVNGEDVIICKHEFLSVHGLQKSKTRVDLIVSKIGKGAIAPQTDQRGKHKNRPNKVDDLRLQKVRDHINSIPKYQSYYSRTVNIGRVFLGCDLSISRLYKEFYIPWCTEQNIDDPVSQDKYRRIFCTEFNIGFKLPKSDTCKTCDEMRIKREMLTNEGKDNEAQVIDVQMKLHQDQAKALQQLLNEKSFNTDPKQLVISFDHQVLPVPKLDYYPAFYRRKLWLYNFGVHECGNGQGHMFLWGEDIAHRGTDEMCSCIIKFLEAKPQVKELIVFTDNCSSQNKNWTMVALWNQLIKEKRLKKIEHFFLVSGHTNLPSESDFDLIDKHQKKFSYIFSPKMWVDIVSKANKKNPFLVTYMERQNFFDVASLLQNIQEAETTKCGKPFVFSTAAAFKFTQECPSSFFIKYTLDSEYEEVHLTRNVSFPAITLRGLRQKYPLPLKINEKKLNDVRHLLPFIPPVYQDYYSVLVSDTSGAVSDEVEII